MSHGMIVSTQRRHLGKHQGLLAEARGCAVAA